MAVLARYHRQRRVTRGSWRPRFTKQKVNLRGSTKPTAPTLASISPTTGVAGAANQTVTCTGTGFVSGITKVVVGVLDMTTTFVSATSVTFVMPLSTLLAGTQTVNVRNGTLMSTTPKTYTITATLGREGEDVDPSNPGDYTIAVLEAWVDAHPDQADEVLEAEEAGQQRVTLINWLQGFISDRDEGHIP